MTQAMFSSFVAIIAAGMSSQVCPSKSPHQSFLHVFGIPICMVQQIVVNITCCTSINIFYISISSSFNLNSKEFQASINCFKSYQVSKIEYFVLLYFNLKLYLNLNITLNFQEFMIQYINMLITYECERILFHVIPCHDGSY